jgi:hypothetical protein
LAGELTGLPRPEWLNKLAGVPDLDGVLTLLGL